MILAFLCADSNIRNAREAIRLVYPALFCVLLPETTTKILTELVLSYQQLYLGKHLELDTRL
jgi:hypothetical protein